MPELNRPDFLHLQAAQGWLELGNPLEAGKELEEIAPECHSHPGVLEVRWHLHAHRKLWDACVDLADAAIARDPNRPEPWIHRSFALHELKRTQEAFDDLLPIARRFPKVWTIPYNLACYCAQLGRLRESKSWLRKAMAIDVDAVKVAAIDDPDLKPVWDSMDGTGGKPRKSI
jgi:tetratricopeptide (TPR) repeat protein